MDSLAAVVQYPLACPHCKSYTSTQASSLLSDGRFSCRVCQKTNKLSGPQLEAVEKTLRHMSGCGLRRTCETAEADQEE